MLTSFIQDPEEIRTHHPRLGDGIGGGSMHKSILRFFS
jgi:hypothetical protein